MPDPTNPNPNPNQDSTTSQTTDNPNSWASPKDGDGDGFVKFRQDDIHPERKIRLGQYLSDHTSGNLAGPDNDNSNPNSSHFPINDPDPSEYSPFINTGHSYTEMLETVAEQYFENLSSQTSFIPSVGAHEGGALEGPIRFQDGHNVLKEAEGIVEAHLEDSLTNTSSRWNGIGVQRFDPNQNPNRYQVQRAGPHLDSTPLDQTMGSRFRSFEHLNGQSNFQTLSNTSFWDEYFTDMSKVGARITMAASGFKDPAQAADLGNRGSVTGGGGLAGHPESLDALQGNYRRVPLSGLQAGNTFDENEGFSDLETSEARTLNGQSWGQLYSWASPYDKADFLDGRGLAVAGQLLEIWAMVQIRVLVITSIFQAASMLLSVLQTPPVFGAKDPLKIPWNRNYYPPDVQEQPGTAFRKGESGFNHSPFDMIDRAMEEINELSANIDNYAGFLVPQLAGGAVNQASKILEEEYLNFTKSVLREVNIYVPRHTLSTSANVSGYNDEGGLLNLLLKTADVATAYNRATAAGLGSLSMHIIGGDYGQSLGFWRNLFREVVRSKAALQEIEIHEQNNSAYESVLKYVGKDDKIMSFVNYLAMLGDMDIGRGFAGKLAFPENKVELKQVSNFPTLRTATNRRKGRPQDKSFQSRLSLTETPSLYLMPKSVRNIRLGLEDTGVEKLGGAWGRFSGKNELMNEGISDEDKSANVDQMNPINQRWQARESNRFSADQVRRIEDQLEAEHMPFYIQDLRTNEIISFHAFLTSLSDSYTGEWSASKGFGRLEAAQIYGGGSRAIGVSFTMVPMNEDDFDEMYVKINKLTTLVYPQWSEGTTITTDEGTFVQPFSQVPTASPLCRLRVGDLFTTNYSKASMARMMGIGKKTFAYGDQEIRRDDSIPAPNEAGEYYVKKRILRRIIRQATDFDRRSIMENYDDDPYQFVARWDPGTEEMSVTFPGPIPIPVTWKTMSEAQFLRKVDEIPSTYEAPGLLPTIGSPEPGPSLSALFSNDNPIFKSFESTMGRGIAVAITGITLDWKLGSVPWELKPGSRAPRMCDVQLSVTPIHDITPGLDHEGVNRAPIYRVGDTMQSMGADPWYDYADKKKLTTQIENQHMRALEGKEGLEE